MGKKQIQEQLLEEVIVFPSVVHKKVENVQENTQ